MPIPKTYKAEKVSTETLAQKAIEVCREMLNIICDRTNRDGEDDSINGISTDLHYFGRGQQLKISRVADSLYSSLKDVLGYVMVETAKRSDCDCKFQMPKHTSYIGSVVKNTAIDVIARSETHQQYLQSLINQSSKYRFDVTSTQFMNLYYDTILKLYERGYLFEDDPELEEIRVLLSQGRAQSSTDAAGVVSISVFPDNNLSQRLTTRNRVIFPYLRRLLETQKAAMVTKRRVDFLNEQIQPDDEIRRVFQEKFDEAMRQNTDNSLNVAADVLRSHCQFLAFNYLKENFSPERVAQLRAYLKSERSISARTHKRYITIPSAKRPRGEDFTITYGEEAKLEDKPFEEQFPASTMKNEGVDNVMSGNLILVGNPVPQESNLVINVQNGGEMPMM
ncbi:hypothetical protein JH06_2783 [Blastocystis sp. subtype 4]|uniref:hypothetical protein n=1 Tax=Blastocystis sp. subtype 4 TaxID=944170 RepID=UPI000711DF46|nr:hypothetical protein JH06_2783 [Blastocystis sp. subtype 4]KNB44342.1 hypothetical protein JH06_2783 [Blastocystis sp. subtype 4]|eukprot:XP_014527779.1 hypothetical protein JH06_2783 [Blastocystis sp. subtype 4]